MAKTKAQETKTEETLDPVFNPDTGSIDLMESTSDNQPLDNARDGKDEWLDESYEGQLAVDVYQKGDEIVVVSTIAGVKASDIDIDVNNDMVTIKGVRREKQEEGSEYFYRECYWGGFSRTIILPVDVRTDSVKATLKNGVLTVRLKTVKATSVDVVEIDDE